MTYDDDIRLLTTHLQKLRQNNNIFESWLNTALELISETCGSSSEQYRNFSSLRNDYRTDKIFDKSNSLIISYINKSEQQLNSIIELIAERKRQAILQLERDKKKQEQEKKEKAVQQQNKPFIQPLTAPELIQSKKENTIDSNTKQKPFFVKIINSFRKISIGAWGIIITVAIASISGAYILGYDNGRKKFDTEKNEYYNEVKILKIDTSKLIQQIKLKDSLIAKYEALIVAFFNNPGELPTLTIVNSKIPCLAGPINECWKESISANAGDTIAIQIYYKNTSFGIAKATTLGLKPMKSLSTDRVVFSGGVASLSGPKTTGEASLEISSKKNVTYIPKSAKWYKTFE